MSYIEYLGERSDDPKFGLKLLNEIQFTSPEHVIEFKEVDGLDGELAIDKERKKNVQKPFSFVVVKQEGRTIEEQITNTNNWLKTNVGWHPLTWGGEPNYIYTAISHQQYPIDRMFATFGKAVIQFTAKPYKFIDHGLVERVVANGQILYNEGSVPAEPLIKITGNGDIALTIGTSTHRLKGVDKGIIIDCKSMIINTLDGLRPAGEKVESLPLPKIPLGQSAITWTGDVSEVKITPRWELVV